MRHHSLTLDHVIGWLKQEAPARLRSLADQVRRSHDGDAVHLRGLGEVSSLGVRQVCPGETCVNETATPCRPTPESAR